MYIRKKHCKELFILLLNLLFSFLFLYFIVVLFHGFFNKHFKFRDTEKFRNADFYRRCMKDALENLGNEVEEEDDNPFTLQIVRK